MSEMDLVELLQTAKIIDPNDMIAISNAAELAGTSVEEIIKREKILDPALMSSIKTGLDLINKKTITIDQFTVAYYDQMTSGTQMIDNLQARGWLAG